MGKNPLDTKQREKVGPATFSKYEYQYHYALCRCIDSHAALNEYLVFVEFHEDVVLGNALDSDSCKFEFCQVKNNKSPKYNQNNLTKIKKKESSVLGKLLSSTENKPYSKLIHKINLAASCGFNLEIKLEGEDYSELCVTELADSCAQFLLAAMQQEIAISELPPLLFFTTPSLPNPGYRETTISKITELMERIYPNSYFKPTNVYTALIDDLHRKGTITHDFQKWDEFVKTKSLTSNKITEIIELNTTHQSTAFQRNVQALCEELDYSALQKITLINEIDAVRIKQAIDTDVRSTRIHHEVRRCVEEVDRNAGNSIMEIIENITSNVSNNNTKLDIELPELIPIIIYHLAQ